MNRHGSTFHGPRAWALSLATACLAACAHTPPPELVQARQTYQRVRSGPAVRLAPAELHNAEEALRDAELSFKSSPDSPATRDLAYVASRKATLADVLAGTQQIVQQNKGELKQAQQAQQQGAAQLQAERQARLEAEARAAALATSLAKLASVKEERRGLVITLSGSVLFRSDEAKLLPAAQKRLDQVAAALLSTKERNVLVEGYTDARGKDEHNLDLSQRRADAVRDYLVSRGYPDGKIQAKGYGKDRPVADNETAEGRANNRRVEIVVEPQGTGRSG